MGLIKQDEGLREQARQVLERWLTENPNSRSASLWQEWVGILNKGAYRRILSRSGRAQQLRQASPLTTILPGEVRRAIMDDIARLKSGFGHSGNDP